MANMSLFLGALSNPIILLQTGECPSEYLQYGAVMPLRTGNIKWNEDVGYAVLNFNTLSLFESNDVRGFRFICRFLTFFS